jgi:hypothetical protein
MDWRKPPRDFSGKSGGSPQIQLANAGFAIGICA